MIVLMDPRSTAKDVEHVVKLTGQMGFCTHVNESATRRVVEVFATNGHVDRALLENAPMVDRVLCQDEPILAASRSAGDENDRTAEIPLGANATIGGSKLGIIAGPCSVESQSQLLEIAAAVKECGAVALRGGAFKPRTSPYSFQGHEERGLEMLALAGEQTGLAIVTEVLRCDHVEMVARYADVLQIGSRNMHHGHLLAAVGRQRKPVLLKRGWSATLQEFLLSAEYIMLEGNNDVILCERGIRTHERYVRNTLALAIVPEIKRCSRLPIIVDPSHGTGQRHLVAPMSAAAVACGADGLLIEVHSDPEKAWTDGFQSLDPEQFRSLMDHLRPFAQAAKREL